MLCKKDETQNKSDNKFKGKSMIEYCIFIDASRLILTLPVEVDSGLSTPWLFVRTELDRTYDEYIEELLE